MANIIPCAPNLTGCTGKRRFRVEWDDADGLMRERHFESYRAAERFALHVDRKLRQELMEGLLDAG